MAWFESHQSLGRHPKMIRLAARVRACRPQVIGHLQYLWWWSIDFAKDGDLSKYSSLEIATASEWNGDSDLWLAALKETGFINEDGTLHDWDDYYGKYEKKRGVDTERKRAIRDVRRMSNGCPTEVQRKAQVEEKRGEENRREKNKTPLPPGGGCGAVAAPASKSKVKADAEIPTIPSELAGAEFAEAWARWREYRRSLRKPLTPQTQRAQLSKLAVAGLRNALEAIEDSISHGWTGLFSKTPPDPKSGAGSGMRANGSKPNLATDDPDSFGGYKFGDTIEVVVMPPKRKDENEGL